MAMNEKELKEYKKKLDEDPENTEENITKTITKQ